MASYARPFTKANPRISKRKAKILDLSKILRTKNNGIHTVKRRKLAQTISPILTSSNNSMGLSLSNDSMGMSPYSSPILTPYSSSNESANKSPVLRSPKRKIPTVPITSGLPLDAKQFLFHTNGTHSLLSSDIEIVSLLKNIDTWVQKGNANKKVADYISNAVEQLAQTHIKSLKRNEKRCKDAHFLQVIHIIQSNIEDTLQKWETYKKPTPIMKDLFGITPTSKQQFTTNKGKVVDVRRQILESLNPGKQCAIVLEDGDSKTCWMCNLPITEETKEEEKCIICEHVLPIKDALQYLNIVQTETQYTDDFDENYRNIMQHEYKQAHGCCNRHKSDKSFTTYDNNTHRHKIHKPNIKHVVKNIITRSNYNEKKNISNAKTKKGELKDCRCYDIVGLKSLSEDDIIGNITKVLEPIVTLINQQIQTVYDILPQRGIKQGQMNAYQVYQMFIKFRFLSQITKDKWINTITNVAIRLEKIENTKTKRSKKLKEESENESNFFGNNESNDKNEFTVPKRNTTGKRTSGQLGGAYLNSQSEIMLLCILQFIPDDFYSTLDDNNISLDDITYHINETHIIFKENHGKTKVLTMKMSAILKMYKELKELLDLKEDIRWDADRVILNQIYHAKKNAVMNDLRSSKKVSSITYKKKLSLIPEELSSPLPQLIHSPSSITYNKKLSP
jgi:hypothetical protein